MISKIVFSIVFAANIYSNSELKDIDTQVSHSNPMVVLDEQLESFKVLANGTDTGWVKKCDVIETEALKNTKTVESLKAHIYKSPSVMTVPVNSLPYGASVEFLDQKQERWLKVAYLSDHGKMKGGFRKKML